MSSGRPSASAMDADAAPSPRSKKRPSRKSDSDWSPNPSPGGSPARMSEHKRRRRTSAESAALALTAVAARASAATSDAGRGAVRRSVRPRLRSARVDGGIGSIHMLGAAAARVGGGRGGGVQKHWSDADEFTLLAAAVAFRERNGRAPRLPDMAELFDSICDSISPHIDQFMVYYKMKRLKSKFQHSDGPRDRRLRNLCSILWGVGVIPSSEDDSDAAERHGVPDAAAMMPVVTEVLGEYWKTNERVMAGVPLEKGLSLLGKKEGRLIETKWRKQLDEEMQSQIRQHDLAKEVCVLLTDAIKGLGP
ncbi:hypothetical protein BAE44_0000462 [Dichanthelium oligosanthes]|uniref:Glabrous enhancer-binding protein-like DBD domain-containing protein n=1 Tax=Dichanthelium oligosanthes TaxID=888268 RepID=A0A1E5WMZ5_9POAL|nr:hypothetical protein BAE44_0000462 [Dichanthelium oligosanthes]